MLPPHNGISKIGNCSGRLTAIQGTEHYGSGSIASLYKCPRAYVCFYKALQVPRDIHVRMRVCVCVCVVGVVHFNHVADVYKDWARLILLLHGMPVIC